MLESSTKEVSLDNFFVDYLTSLMGIFIVKKRMLSLPCVSSETHNLQRVFHPWGKSSPLYRLNRYVPRQRVCFFNRFGLK